MSRQSLLGSNDLENQVVGIDINTVEYAQADMSSNTFSVPVKSGVIILGVGHEVTTVFAGGATPTVTIGDGTTAAKFAASAEIVPETAGTYCFKVASKMYASAGAIVVTAHADVTSGAGKLFIFTIDPTATDRLSAL